MMQTVCLIGAPKRGLDPVLPRELGRLLRSRPRWLAEAEACEFPLDRAPRAETLAEARRLVGGHPADLSVVPATGRAKRLLVSDMDSTIITVECIDEIADLLGIKAEVAAITRRAMNGELDFRSALQARVALLAGLPESVLDEVHRERVRLMPGARTLVRTMRARGALTALVSGGFAPLVDRVAREVGFEVAQANRLELADGRLTGRLLEPVRGAEDKLALLERLRAERGLRPEQTLAVGDGANDLPMICAAGLGVAFRPHPTVARAARVVVRHGDLTALLYLQGIPRAEFADD
jgi:phosphoserine phosphatase